MAAAALRRISIRFVRVLERGLIAGTWVRRHHATILLRHNAQNRPEERLPEAQRTIAVIEDDPVILSLVQNVLGSGGYRVVATGDPTTRLPMRGREAPDLVLCDIVMPNMDGYGVLKALQSDPATARFPVVFLTANREFSERVQAFRFGVVDYITKPFTRDVLLRKVQRLLHGLSQ